MVGAMRTLMSPAMLAGLLAAGIAAPAALAQSVPEYEAWTPSDAALVEELRGIVAQARRDQAASPGVLADLEALLERHAAGAPAGPAGETTAGVAESPVPQAPLPESPPARDDTPAAAEPETVPLPEPPVEDVPAAEIPPEEPLPLPPPEVEPGAEPGEEPAVELPPVVPEAETDTAPAAEVPAVESPLQTVFSDDFADGELAADPSWVVLQGDWQADAARGLLSDARAPDGGDPGVAAIAIEQQVANAFSIDLDLADVGGTGQFEVRVYQGSAREYGYRLVFRADGRPHFAIYRSGVSGIVQLASSTAAHPLTEGGASIQWTRDAAGEMRVTVNGVTAVATLDDAFRDPWRGVMLVNFGGDFAVGSITAAQ